MSASRGMTLGVDRLLDGKVRPRVLGVRLLERLDRALQALGRSIGRHLHHQAHVEVARRAALRIAHAAPGETKPLPALAPAGHLEPHRAVRRRHRDGRAPPAGGRGPGGGPWRAVSAPRRAGGNPPRGGRRGRPPPPPPPGPRGGPPPPNRCPMMSANPRPPSPPPPAAPRRRPPPEPP